jgi:hypothetical protein
MSQARRIRTVAEVQTQFRFARKRTTRGILPVRMAIRLAMGLAVMGTGGWYLLGQPQQQATSEQVQMTDYIQKWSQLYNVSTGWMVDVAECESSLNPAAYNPSGATGLFQFKPTTYYYWRNILNWDTTYAPGLASQRQWDPEWRDVNDPEAQTHVAAYMFYRGHSYEWECVSRYGR